MKRALLTQIKNEWRDNLWMVIELSLVALVVWGMSMIIIHQTWSYSQPRGFDYEDVWVLGFKHIESDSPLHIDMGEETAENDLRDVGNMLARLRSMPQVEAVAMSSNGRPYQFNYTGNQFRVCDIPDTMLLTANTRMATPGYARVMHPESLTGETPTELDERLARGEVLVSAGVTGRNVPEVDWVQYKGARLGFNGDDSENARRFVIGDIINTVRRTDFEYKPGGTVIIPMVENEMRTLMYTDEILVRVRPGMGEAFREALTREPASMRIRNIAVSNPHPLAEYRASAQSRDEVRMRQMVGLILFLLFVVFLGLLGTFWFRVQQRTGEIAMRMVCGATRMDVMRRLQTEGLVMLGVATVVAALLEVALVWWQMDEALYELTYFVGWEWRFILGWGGTFLMMWLMMAIGIWMPARRAMRIRPAIALRCD